MDAMPRLLDQVRKRLRTLHYKPHRTAVRVLDPSIHSVSWQAPSGRTRQRRSLGVPDAPRSRSSSRGGHPKPGAGLGLVPVSWLEGVARAKAPKRAEPLKTHLAAVRERHLAAIKAGYGGVELPYALARKYPSAPAGALGSQAPHDDADLHARHAEGRRRRAQSARYDLN
jgi:hypothetical protein